MAKAPAQAVEGNTKRTSKAAATATAAPTKTEGTGEKGAPRPRKFDYGIQGENKVSVADAKAEPKLKAQEAEGYATAQKGCTVEAFLKAHDRGILRRLSRKGLVTVTGTDGTVYPKEYVAPEKPAPKQEAGEKAA
jgi:hypothetical protein